MDPLSQGVLGAAAPQALARNELKWAGLLGFLAGMSADLDVLIRSQTDPLLFLEFHRQFTHALVFIPFGGLICACVLYFLFARRRLSFRATYLYCTLGYATHGLLDSCTSYGTQLLWPFSNARFAWHSISIIDPLFTVPLLAGVLLSARSGRRVWARAALLWIAIYLSLGFFQRDRAESFGQNFAATRGHTGARVEAKPAFGTLLLWKTIYEFEGKYFVDAVRLGLTTTHYAGQSVPKLKLARDFPWLDPSSQQARDIERFRWFSAGYLALSATHDDTIIDMRYSMLPHRVDGLWGVVLSRHAGVGEHVKFLSLRNADEATRHQLAAMILGD